MGEGARTEDEDPSAFRHVLCRAGRALERASVPHLVFGSVASSHYGKPAASGDVDVLIAPADEGRALEELRRTGFETDETDQTWLSKAFLDGVMVDLVTQLTGDLFLDDEMLAHARRAMVGGCEVSMVSPEDLVLIEAATNSPETEAHWYLAIGILMRTELDWDYLLERARLAPRRILSLLVYAQSDDIEVPDRVVRQLLDRLYAPV
jgi:predicted nucleotidyltransferase